MNDLKNDQILPLNLPPRLVLVTGPARSGKSEWAEYLATHSQKQVVYIATAQCYGEDAEWQSRIVQHQIRRPSAWMTLEVPIELSTAIASNSADCCLLIDSLGTWLTNLLEWPDANWTDAVRELTRVLKTSQCDVILVAEEVGWGIVPAYPIGRTFRDRLGYLVRQVSAIADQVYLVAGGHILDLSKLGTPLHRYISPATD